MKFSAKGSADFAIAPEGNHVAICNGIVDLGIQPGSAKYPDPKHRIYVRFELPDEQIEYTKDGQKIKGPMTLGKSMTASMNGKAVLRQFVESWLGRKMTDEQAADFDLQTLLGKRCLLNVTHSVNGDRTRADIGMATPLPRSMTSEHEQHNPDLFFDLKDPDQKAYDRLPNWLKEKISARLDPPKVAASVATPVAAGDFDDDIPYA